MHVNHNVGDAAYSQYKQAHAMSLFMSSNEVLLFIHAGDGFGNPGFW